MRKGEDMRVIGLFLLCLGAFFVFLSIKDRLKFKDTSESHSDMNFFPKYTDKPSIGYPAESHMDDKQIAHSQDIEPKVKYEFKSLDATGPNINDPIDKAFYDITNKTITVYKKYFEMKESDDKYVFEDKQIAESQG